MTLILILGFSLMLVAPLLRPSKKKSLVMATNDYQSARGTTSQLQLGTLDEESRRSIKAYPPEEEVPFFEAWAGSGVPAAVSPAAVSVLARAFPAVVASAFDAAARLAAF